MLVFLQLHGHYQVWKHDEAERIYKVIVQNTKIMNQGGVEHCRKSTCENVQSMYLSSFFVSFFLGLTLATVSNTAWKRNG